MRSSHLNRSLTVAAFGLGLGCIFWIASGFVGHNALALVITLAIAVAYAYGSWEVSRYRSESRSLGLALGAINQEVSDLRDWVGQLPTRLQTPVCARIEGERAGLPGLSLTPYLVGLLVMLGMLGTFVGMVLTFKGAVFALEGSADLAAMRTALAEPIKGLGLSFGTSVAGVAASAALGLMSAMARRDRQHVMRMLDDRMAREFRAFSPAAQRQATFQALKDQADALPEVVQKIQSLMEQIDARSQALDTQLLERQGQLHASTASAFEQLARSVEQSLGQALVSSAKAASESLQPVVGSAMAMVASESRQLHEQVNQSVQMQLAGLSDRFAAATDAVASQWRDAVAMQGKANADVQTNLDRALTGFNERLEQSTGALVERLGAQMQSLMDAQSELDTQRQSAWVDALQASTAGLQNQWKEASDHGAQQQQLVCRQLQSTAQAIAEATGEQASRVGAEVDRLLAQSEALVQSRAEAEASWREVHDKSLEDMTQWWRSEMSALRSEEAARSQAAATQQRELQEAMAQQLSSAVEAILGAAQAQTGSVGEEVTRLLARSDELVQARADSEAKWRDEHGRRMDEMAQMWSAELAALRNEEAQRGESASQRQEQMQEAFARQLETLRAEEEMRGQAATDRLGQLQAAVAEHLSRLGSALEAPMTRLLETASEAPKAAAEVIGQLRAEMSSLTERDNQALQERAELMGNISQLLQGVQQTTGEQRDAIETLVTSASSVLDKVSQQFSQTLGAQAERSETLASDVAASAAELASLGEAFQRGVELFSVTNEKLVDNLQRVEAAIGQSMARSDEQLAYYVEQAREVIDLSISAQQGIVEDLRALRHSTAEAAGSEA